ncbi:MAG TPA: hypothetical protein DIW81_06405 [Planctomycetaceae bacterium]|nr:hypothetical protein [Planctomycetaceae bacterium]
MFYYMRFIEGETLDDAIRRFHQNRSTHGSFAEQSVEFRRLLTSFVSACRTIAYAHNRGIVHRDIKPGNIMLGKYGETLVVDWGLAMPVNRDQRFVSSGEVSLRPKSSGTSAPTSASGLGTAAYMSPEQASELAAAPASDIYSLGASLYKILTGVPSISGDQPTNKIKEQITTGDIIPPSKRLSSVPPALDAICQHAMAFHPRDRYATASDLAEDIERYLADSDVSVYQEPWRSKLLRMVRKHQLAAQAALAGVLAVLLVSLGAAIWLGNLASAESDAKRSAEQHQADAEAAEGLADEIRKNNLQMSATFLADSIAHQVDQHWRIMESARSSPTLIKLVMALNQSPENAATQEDLQRWLSECKEYRDVFKSQNAIWVLFGEHGQMLARVPRNRIIGNSYSHRDYFHGYGKDLAEEDPELEGVSLDELTPHQFLLEKLADHEKLHSAHISDVFQSTGTNTLQVTFSVPIWDQPVEELEKRAVGLFAISLQIQNLPLPENAMLVQLRRDQISNEPGLIVSHHELSPRTEDNLPPRIDDQVIETANRVTARRLQELRRIGANVSSEASSFLPEFIDPVLISTGQASDPCYAALEPVLVRTRPEQISDIGWVVIVKEPEQIARVKN